jgi:hypothetical protein
MDVLRALHQIREPHDGIAGALVLWIVDFQQYCAIAKDCSGQISRQKRVPPESLVKPVKWAKAQRSLFYVKRLSSFNQQGFKLLPGGEHIRYNLGVQVFPMAVYEFWQMQDRHHAHRQTKSLKDSMNHRSKR